MIYQGILYSINTLAGSMSESISLSEADNQVNESVRAYRDSALVTGKKIQKTSGYSALLAVKRSFQEVYATAQKPQSGTVIQGGSQPLPSAPSFEKELSVNAAESYPPGDQRIELYALSAENREQIKSYGTGPGTGLSHHVPNKAARVQNFISGAGQARGMYASEGRMNHQQVTDHLVRQYNNALQSDRPDIVIRQGLFETGHNWIQWYFPILTPSGAVGAAVDSMLDEKSFIYLRQNPLIKKAIFCNALIFAKFLGFDYCPESNTFKAVDRTKNQADAFWKNALYPGSYDHNHNWLRISRVMASLRHMGLGELAASLHVAIVAKIRDHEKSNKLLQDSKGLEISMGKWHEALQSTEFSLSQGDVDFDTVRAIIFAKPEGGSV